MSDLISRAMAKAEIMDWARVITNQKMLSTEDTMHILDNMEAVTDEEFEAEAKRRGYYLQKKSENVKFLPCICGANRRTEWWNMKEHGWSYECNRCGQTSLVGKTKKDAKLNWNRMIEEKMKDAAD